MVRACQAVQHIYSIPFIMIREASFVHGGGYLKGAGAGDVISSPLAPMVKSSILSKSDDLRKVIFLRK